MLMLSCSVTLICVMVTVACVASVCRDSPRTLASDRKLESHSAFSPGARRGISVGGVAGSNVRFAKATGCLLIVGTGTSLGWRRDEKSRHVSQPKISTPSSTQSRIKPREGNTASAPIFRIRTRANHEFAGGGWRERYSHRAADRATDKRRTCPCGWKLPVGRFAQNLTFRFPQPHLD